MTETLLVTGGSGFIGSNFVRLLLETNACRVVNLDALTYAGNPDNLSDFEGDSRYHFVRGDIRNKDLVDFICRTYAVEGIINFAAETHVDRSIHGAEQFIGTNVHGTLVLLEAVRTHGLKRFVQVSTDEVYGSLGPTGRFSESSPLQPTSPYSASKTGADLLVSAFVHTHGVPALITRCSNNYGPYQFPEKLIPLMILNALDDQALPVYGDGLNVRDWIYVRDHCMAIWDVYQRGKVGETYNIGANCEKPNLEIVKTILGILGKPESLIRFVADRPGHDRRYAVDASKISSELGWRPATEFGQALSDTVQWYCDHPEWCARVRSGAYRKYYARQYAQALETPGA